MANHSNKKRKIVLISLHKIRALALYSARKNITNFIRIQLLYIAAA